MSYIDHAIKKQQEDIRRCRLGIIEGDVAKLEARLAELFCEREAQHGAYVDSFSIVEKLVTPKQLKSLRRPGWYQPMSPDEYIERGQIKTQKYTPRP